MDGILEMDETGTMILAPDTLDLLCFVCAWLDVRMYMCACARFELMMLREVNLRLRFDSGISLREHVDGRARWPCGFLIFNERAFVILDYTVLKSM